jgi:hypothetical protein
VEKPHLEVLWEHVMMCSVFCVQSMTQTTGGTEEHRLIMTDYGRATNWQRQKQTNKLPNIQSINELTNRIFKHSHFHPANQPFIQPSDYQQTKQPTIYSPLTVTQSPHTLTKAPEHDTNHQITLILSPQTLLTSLHTLLLPPPVSLQPVTLQRIHWMQFTFLKDPV